MCIDSKRVKIQTTSIIVNKKVGFLFIPKPGIIAAIISRIPVRFSSWSSHATYFPFCSAAEGLFDSSKTVNFLGLS